MLERRITTFEEGYALLMSSPHLSPCGRIAFFVHQRHTSIAGRTSCVERPSFSKLCFAPEVNLRERKHANTPSLCLVYERPLEPTSGFLNVDHKGRTWASSVQLQGYARFGWLLKKLGHRLHILRRRSRT